MADERDLLRQEYKLVLSHSEKEKDFQNKCVHFLKERDTNDCFKLLPLVEIQNEYQKRIEKKNDIKYGYLGHVMENIERYSSNLLKKPWCKDFHTIKIFNGFFKYKIEQWISFDKACKILCLIGYDQTGAGTFEIKNPEKERVLAVSFELYLASIRFSLNNSSNLIYDETNKQHKPSSISSEILKTGQDLVVSDETVRSDTVTTPTESQHYDKNGQSTGPQSTYEDSYDLATAHEIHRNTGVPKSGFISLHTPNISDDQLYGDEDDSATQSTNSSQYFSCLKPGNGASPQEKMFRGRGSNESGLAMRQPPYVSSKYQAKLLGSQSPMSMPTVHSVGNGQHGPDFYSRDDSQLVRRYQHNPNIKTGQKKDYVGRSSSMQISEALHGTGSSQNSSEMGQNNISSTEISKYHEKFEEIEKKKFSVYLPQLRDSSVENMSVQHKFNTEESTGHQFVSTDVLLARKKRTDKIFLRRLDGSKGSIHQRSSMQTESSNDIVADNVSGKNKLQCSTCGEVPVIMCEKCQEVVCEGCLKIMTKSPCILNQEHKYKIIEEEVALCHEVSSSPSLQVDNLVQKLSSLDINDSEKWQCEHCTWENSADKTVCVTCNHTKHVKVQQLEPGGWVCGKCTLVNPTNTSQCKACEERKGENPHSYV